MTAFKNEITSANRPTRQLELFQKFLCNTEEQRKKLSNSIEFWDSVPRYSISQISMNKMRDPHGQLKVLELQFSCQMMSYKAVIRPARIDGTDYYPSADEELVEEALRKIAAEQNCGAHERYRRSGVVFTLHQLRKELAQNKHTRSYNEIVRSLDILSLSSIEIQSDKKMKGFDRSAYFPRLSAVSKKDYKQDPNSKWYVEFHPLITRSIDQLTYRQFNYAKLMQHKTQLARWLQKQLSLKFNFASPVRTFEMRFSTIARDSAMLNNYSRDRHKIAACNISLDELVNQRILQEVKRSVKTGARGKITDVIYTLIPSLDFIAEAKAANLRMKQHKERMSTAQ